MVIMDAEGSSGTYLSTVEICCSRYTSKRRFVTVSAGARLYTLGQIVQNAVAGLEERGCHRTRTKIFDGQRSILETYWNAGLKHGSPVETKALFDAATSGTWAGLPAAI